LQEARGAIRGTRTDSLLTVADASFTASEGFGFHPAESRLRLAEVRLLRGDAGAAYTMAARLVADSSLADEARMLAGRAALAAERPQDAVAVLAPAFQADSLSVEGLALLGDAYLRLELPAYAASALYRAHERRPDDWRVGVNLAIAWAENDDFDRAEKLLREVVQRFPNEPYALQNLAAVLQRLGHREEAERLLQRVNELRER
jgi:Flp pilus assembly protein TadD